MPAQELHVVTGAFGYSGRYITARLLRAGHRVRTLTNSPERANPFGNAVEVRRFDFYEPVKLTESLCGAAVLYNTYWVRFTHGDFSHVGAVENTMKLFAAAKSAGVGRVVHGKYRLQPIHVDDFAKLAVAEGQATQNRIINAIGPETFTYRELVECIGEIIGKRRLVISLPPRLAWSCGWLIGKFLGDVIVTYDEVKGLMRDLLYTDSQPAGRTPFTDWATQNAATLGIRYASELARRRDRREAYERL